MAANRTFQFYGNGYGDGVTPAAITVVVAGTTVYSGTVPTLNLPIDPEPPYEPENQVVLFSIADSAALNTDFSGSLTMNITVTAGYGVNFGQIYSNYFIGNVIAEPGAGTVDNFNQNYYGNPPNSDGSEDPRSSVTINGQAQSTSRPPNGTWNWLVPVDSVLAYNWNIATGQVGNIPGSSTTYSGPYTTTPMV